MLTLWQPFFWENTLRIFFGQSVVKAGVPWFEVPCQKQVKATMGSFFLWVYATSPFNQKSWNFQAAVPTMELGTFCAECCLIGSCFPAIHAKHTNSKKTRSESGKKYYTNTRVAEIKTQF